MRGILCSSQGEPVPVSKIMMYSRAVESDAKNARGMGRDRTVPSPNRSRLICAWIVLFSPRPYYLRAWHRLPKEYSFTTYQTPHDDTGQ